MTTLNQTDLTHLSHADLESVIQKAKDEQAKRHQQRLLHEISELKKYAEEKGFMVDQIFVPDMISAAPKYRHPTNPDLTWSGKGRRPAWLTDLLLEGTDLDALRIT